MRPDPLAVTEAHDARVASAVVAHTRRTPSAGPLIIAHRGAWDGAIPQNSLEAFERAVAAGADAIELDVRRTLDGRLVVVHDAHIAGRPVGAMHHGQLQARLKDGQAPALEEVLAIAAGRIAVDVELKEDGYVSKAMRVVGRTLTPDQYVVTSFRDAVLPEVRRTVPEARTGLLLHPYHRLGPLERRLRDTKADFLAPHARMSRFGVLSWAADRDIPAWVWTVNDRRALDQHLSDPRVAAVITDRLDRALPAINDRHE
jgi:glycerophosphoryl diester phosphodiesterase